MRDILRENLNDPDIRQQIINMYTDNKDYILHVMNDRIKALEFHSAKYKDRASKTELEKAKKALNVIRTLLGEVDDDTPPEHVHDFL